MQLQLDDVRKALESLKPWLPPPMLPPMPSPAAPPPLTQTQTADMHRRATRVWMPSESCAAALEELPDAFFERTPEEVAAEAAARRSQLAASQVLTTKAWKQRQGSGSADTQAAITRAVLRVRVSDGCLLQGVFSPTDRLADVAAWVADCLAEPHRTFVLHPPRGVRPCSDEATRLLDAGLCPSAVLTLRWGPDEPPVEGPVLRPDLMAGAARLE